MDKIRMQNQNHPLCKLVTSPRNHSPVLSPTQILSLHVMNPPKQFTPIWNRNVDNNHLNQIEVATKVLGVMIVRKLLDHKIESTYTIQIVEEM